MAQSAQSVQFTAAKHTLTTIALCFAVAVLEGFDIQALGVVVPKLRPAFGFDDSQMKWILAMSNIGLVFGASIGGRLADRVGRKPVFIASVLMFGLFTLATAFANSYESFLIIRFLTGLGFGAALPNMMAIAAEISPPKNRALTASAMFCGMPFGGGTSALVTQLLPHNSGWQTLFLIGGILPALLAPALYFFMNETLDKSQQTSTAIPPLAKSLFADGRAAPTVLLWVIFLPTLLILYLILGWLPRLVVINGLDPAVSPQASAAFNYASVAGALLFGKIVDRFGPRWPLGFAYAILLVTLIALGSATQLALVLFLSGAAGFFLMGANYSLYGVAAAYYPKDMRGTGSGASVAVGRIGSIFGPLLAGILLSGGGNTSTVMMYLAPMAAIAGIAVIAVSFFPHAE